MAEPIYKFEVLIGAVLAHGAEPAAVLNLNATDLERGKNLRDGSILALDCGSGEGVSSSGVRKRTSFVALFRVVLGALSFC